MFGLILKEKGEYDNVVEMWKKGIELDPDHKLMSKKMKELEIILKKEKL